MFARPVVPLEERSTDEESQPEVVLVDKVLRVQADGLLVSLEHEIELVSTQDLYRS